MASTGYPRQEVRLAPGKAMTDAQGTRAARVTIAGGGIAAIECVLALRDLAPGAAVELLAPQTASPLRPLSVLVPFAFADPREIDLARFASEQGVALVRDTLVAVDAENRTVRTGRGDERSFDALVVAAGARALEAVPGAILFRGPGDERRLALLHEEYAGRDLRSLAFAVPTLIGWSLPIYELALLTAASLSSRGVSGVRLSVVTPEPEPLAVFGQKASQAVVELLDGAGIELRAGTRPERVTDGKLVTDRGEVAADRVVALPRLVGPGFPGLATDEEGFIETDDHGTVRGQEDVYAAGDVVAFPIKQGGLAAQQADAVAESIAASMGADIDPQPFRPVMRGLLLTGSGADYLERRIGAGADQGEPARPALWQPESKVFGRYLLRYLGVEGGPEFEPSAEPAERDLAVDIESPPAAS
jgi:sulfide:quinone oxidoreductase